MKNEQTPDFVRQTATSGHYEPPRLTAVGEMRDVVLGVPMSGWDWRGFAVRDFEFESDEE